MTDLKHPLALALTLALGLAAGTAGAQDAPAPATEAPAAEAPATEAPAAETTAETTADAAPEAAAADGPGTTYIAETHGDWSIQCARAAEGNDPCQMYQLLKDANGTSVADISIFPLPEGGKAVAGATIMTPLETLLTQNLVLKIDTQDPKVYPYSFCAPVGCISRVGLTPGELDSFRKGNTVTMQIVPVATPDKPVSLTISLKGFTAAYEAVEKTFAAAKQ